MCFANVSESITVFFTRIIPLYYILYLSSYVNSYTISKWPEYVKELALLDACFLAI